MDTKRMARIASIRKALKEVEERQRREDAQKEQEAIEFLKTLVSSGVLEKNNAEVWVFGSLVRGEMKRWSDIDLVIMKADDEIRTVGDILFFPRGDIEVEVCVFDWLDEYMRESVLREGVPVHEFVKRPGSSNRKNC